MTDLHEVLNHHLADWQSGWSMGSFGAIAEFHQAPGEPAATGDLFRVTDRGGIRLSLSDDTVPVAYETLSPKPHRWSQAVALCLPEEAAAQARRAVLTELGPDTQALRDQDRDAILFDIGLAQPQVDFCIRTADPALIETLRAHTGRSVFEPGNPVMGTILSAHPHRIAVTALGRVEVYQLIGGPETDDRSPEGPHTHVLPKLLASGRTHSANVPIPGGLVPCASLHPGNPVIGPLGEDRDFDPELFDAFQRLLVRWGNAEYVSVKSAVLESIGKGLPPQSLPFPETRIGRTALRNAVRQELRRTGDSEHLRDWAGIAD